jgi:glycosyltransferase involved in cell wall biosynthesis
MVRNSPQIPAILRPLGGFMGKVVFENNVALSKTITVAGRYLKEDIKAGDVRIVPNGVDTEIFRFSPNGGLRSSLKLDDSFVLGYIGALREWVDLEPVFKSVSELKSKFNIRLLIVGGEEGFLENKKLAAKYGVENETLFIGAVPYAEVPGYISCMDACLIPFRKNKVADNSCPLKLFEYMACERPVICTRIREVESIVGDRILYASEASEYQEAMTKLYNDKSLRAAMGQRGRTFVTENYEWSKLSSDFEEILLEASKGGPR